jgi:hypothetical protein
MYAIRTLIMDITRLRLTAQHIAQADFATAKEVVSHMLAMQAQDYPGALWAIALRTPNLTREGVEKAIIDRQIVRTWPMRGTLHFLAAEDARWMVKLLAPRTLSISASRRRELEIDDSVIAKGHGIIGTALSGGKCITRPGLCQILEDNGIATGGQRGIHILHHLAELGILCFGPHEGKQPTFVLMDEWLPSTPEKPREEALAELATRYFTSHGPASFRDFAGWASLTVRDAKLGLELAGNKLASQEINGVTYWQSPSITPATPATYLLPGFDEYMLGYKDRSAALALEHANKIVPGNNGMFLATLVIDGQIAGTWRRTARAKSQQITIMPFVKLTKQQIASIEPAVKRYEQYIGVPITWEVAS